MNAPQTTSGAPATREAAPATIPELMAQALAIEIEAAQRYTELADVMETHNNREVAALFRRMAVIEARHADAIIVGARPFTPLCVRSRGPSRRGAAPR